MHIQQLSEIDHGNKGGLGFKTKSVSSLRPAASAGSKDLCNEISYTLAKWFGSYSYFFMAAWNFQTDSYVSQFPLCRGSISKQSRVAEMHNPMFSSRPINRD
ncbi:hypothetical protein PVAP13_5KG570607 [Panicum virgatum]|uniref:Uncharacterized protein n=1 Tax=Panicum virgatum TaxID=38727 RepID=A0A8T0SR06_PANVG|nr:hypothetical protein PVAP13_5KG570607 [Panicum virgatum]